MNDHRFSDRYEVGEIVAFGGMSVVHRGFDRRVGREVAIKVLGAHLAHDPCYRARFRQEAEHGALLSHPGIVAVYDVAETMSGTVRLPFIVMEYVDGLTLRELLRVAGFLTPEAALRIVDDLCSALDFAHRCGIVHRDLHPANVMVNTSGAVKVMDFGAARATVDDPISQRGTGTIVGTPGYLSPEQICGWPVDARSDVYAVGCVLFELLVGAPPFTGGSPVAVAREHLRTDPGAPSDRRPGTPGELDRIVLKAMNKHPLNRYQTIGQMQSDLLRALTGEPTRATRRSLSASVGSFLLALSRSRQWRVSAPVAARPAR